MGLSFFDLHHRAYSCRRLDRLDVVPNMGINSIIFDVVLFFSLQFYNSLLIWFKREVGI